MSCNSPNRCFSALALAVLLAGCTQQTSPSQAKKTQPVVVKTVSVQQQEVRQTTAQPATVLPFFQAEIRAKVSGYVGQVKAEIGDYVEEGAALAIIHVPEMQKQVKVIEARVTRFQAEEKRAQAGIDLAAANVESANAMLTQSKSLRKSAAAALAAAEAEFTRTKDLVERRSLETRVLDEVRKKRDTELANVESVDSAVISAEAGVVVAQAKQTAAEADLQAAQAETAIAQRQLEELNVLIEYATLTAPFAGIVTSRTVDPGDLVREANDVGEGKPLFVISQTEKVRVQIPVPEADAAMVERGNEITLSFPSFTDEQPMIVTVTRTAESLDPSTRTMLVEAEVDNKDRRLIAGMFGQATIRLSGKQQANMLPARAIRFRETGEAYVYIVDDNDTVTVTNIKTGLDTGPMIEVVSGIDLGQRVIDAHLQRFVSGQQVVILKN